MTELTLKSVVVRGVDVPLNRPIIAHLGTFEKWPYLCIDLITKDLGKSYKPDRVIFLKDLPKTRNMKIMRRVIKSCLIKDDPGDISTLLNPESVEEIKEYAI